MPKTIEHKKYSVTYTSGATGYGWEQEYDHIKDFERLVDEYRKERTVYLTVWDNEIEKFIFFKRVLSAPEIDMLHSWDRDLRTRTRKHKA